MSENSDGNKDIGQKTTKKFEHCLTKTRSFSVGSVDNISISDVNIFRATSSIRDSDLKSKQTKTLSSTSMIRGSDNKTELPGNIDKFENSSENRISDLSECNLFIQSDDVFKPRKSVARTPPPEKIGYSNEEIEMSNKRPRSENTPEMDKNLKRQCEGNLSSSHQNNINPNNPNIRDSGPLELKNRETLTENVILEIFSAMETINNISEKQLRNKEEDRNLITSSISAISKNLSLMIFKIGKLETENMQLKQKETKLDGSSRTEPEIESSKETKETPFRKTYATVTERKIKPIEENKKSTEEWKTPETRKKLETVIHIDQVTDSQETMRRLKSEMTISNKMNTGFKNIRHLKNGAVVIESCNETQQEKLKSVLQNRPDIKIKETQNIDPMFMITGIAKGFSDQDFIDEIIRLNSEIETELQCNVGDKMKIIARKTCRNPTKENFIVQAPAKISKWFLKKQTIIFDLVLVYVQEHINLAVCFQCSGFGHVARYCKEEKCCHKCGGQHQSKDCQSNEIKCPNCTKMKYKPEESQHTARDMNCPVYKRKLLQFREQINYSSSFL